VFVTSPEQWGLSPYMFHEDWKTFLVHFRNFAALGRQQGRCIESPTFTCNDQDWSLSLYPGGDDFDYTNDVALLCCFPGDEPGHVSMYLNHRSRGNATATFEVKIINKYGDAMETRRSSDNRQFDIISSNSGWSDIIKVSDILDESKHILDSNGTLTVAVSMKPISMKSTSVSSGDSEPAPTKLDSTVSDELPGEPSWMEQQVIVDTPSCVKADLIDASYQTDDDDSDGQPDDFDKEPSLVSTNKGGVIPSPINQDVQTDPGNSDCRDDDEISIKAESLKDDVISVTSPEMRGLPPTAFHGEWESFLIHFPNFAENSTSEGRRLESPEFECNGQKWALRLYPGGNTSADYTRYVGLYLNHRSSGNATATFEIMIINKYGNALETRRSSDNRLFDSSRKNSGWNDMIKVSDVMDDSKNILDKNSTLTVVVSMKSVPIRAKKAHAKKVQPMIGTESDLVLKRLIINCLRRNEQLMENSTIGSRGGDKVQTLQRDPSLASREGQHQLPKTRHPTRDPPELTFSTQRPERNNETVQLSRDALSQPPRPEDVRYPRYSPNNNLQPPASVHAAPVHQPPRPEEVRYPRYFPNSNPHPPAYVHAAPVQNDVYSSQKSYCSAPSPYLYGERGERGLSSQAMERRSYYKEMILQQQLKIAHAHVQLGQAQRHIYVNKIE